MHVTPHAEGNRFNVDPIRPRKLLLTKRELIKLSEITQQKGLTLVPMSLFCDRGFAKMEIGLGKGKKLHDKRDSIKSRDVDRELQRYRGA